MAARQLFFRRNLHTTGLSLAAVALKLGEPQWATEWWAAAGQFASVGQGSALTVEGPARTSSPRLGAHACLQSTAALQRIANTLGRLPALYERVVEVVA
ncbi:MAG: hypothetical protein QOD83_2150 [Solirubrobacteraceae bacterium]|nr:hypothetical protein [Solirubrobacteraceae bacterium]